MADLIAVLLAAMCQMLGAGDGSPEHNATLAAEVLKSQPVPIAEVVVDTEGWGNNGVEQFSLGLNDVLIDPLEIDELQFVINDILIEGEDSATLSGIAFTARISEADLTSALQLHTQTLSDATIAVTKESLELSGTYPLWGMRIPYRVAGNLVVQKDTQLVFKIASSGIGAINSPAALNGLIEREINPVYDLADFAARSKKDIKLAKEQLDYEFKLQIDRIEPGQGHIIVTGTA